LADAFFEKGIYSAEELAESSIDELVEIRGIGQEKAEVLIENARQFIAEAKESKHLEAEAGDAEGMPAALQPAGEESGQPMVSPADGTDTSEASDAESIEEQ
jgi:N utilization substance protein A